MHCNWRPPDVAQVVHGCNYGVRGTCTATRNLRGPVMHWHTTNFNSMEQPAAELSMVWRISRARVSAAVGGILVLPAHATSHGRGPNHQIWGWQGNHSFLQSSKRFRNDAAQGEWRRKVKPARFRTVCPWGWAILLMVSKSKQNLEY